MNNYTVEQLANPETYTNDPELSEFVYKLAGSIKQDFPLGTDIVVALQSGQEAERVHKSWQKRRAKWMAENVQHATELNEAEVVVGDLQLPDGVIVALPESAPEIWLIIPRDGGLMTPKIKRLGGWWDIEHCRFVLPLNAAQSLPRVLKNWEKAYNKKSAEIAKQKRAQAEQEQQRRDQRARERAEERRQQQAQATVARANRQKIEVGKYQIGQEINGQEIKSFGKTWTETQPDYSKWGGTRYQEHCGGCGRYSDEIENSTDLCPKCFPHKTTVTVCYAYFV